MTLGRRGTTALEFALTAPVLLTLMFGGFEFARMLWTWQALQLAGDQTARCVAIKGTACGSPSAYAVASAAGYGAVALSGSGVVIDTATAISTGCVPSSGNTAVRVQLSLAFTSPFTSLVPALGQTLNTTSCYPQTGD